MAGHAHNTADEKHGAAHGDSHYVKIWGILLVLLVISIAGPEVAPAFPASIAKGVVLITAFGIAFVKAWLVVKYFMHLTVEQPVVRYMLVTCLVFMGLFFAGVSPDVLRHTGRNWTNVAAVEAIARVQEEQAARAAAGDAHGEPREMKPVEEQSELAQQRTDPPPPAFKDLSDAQAKQNWLMTLGENIYNHGSNGVSGSACVSCHGQGGAGLPGLTESLKGAESLADCAAAARITLNGSVAEIQVDGVARKSVMPGFKSLNDEQTAAVLTYMRSSFGNTQGVCEPAQVASAR